MTTTTPAASVDTGLAAPGPTGSRPLIPPVLYLPTAGLPGDEGMTVELRETRDGRRALLAYTALDRLADGCGPHQPWALVPTDRLGDLGVDYDVIHLDLTIPAHLRHTPTAGSHG